MRLPENGLFGDFAGLYSQSVPDSCTWDVERRAIRLAVSDGICDVDHRDRPGETPFEEQPCVIENLPLC